MQHSSSPDDQNVVALPLKSWVSFSASPVLWKHKRNWPDSNSRWILNFFSREDLQSKHNYSQQSLSARNNVERVLGLSKLTAWHIIRDCIEESFKCLLIIYTARRTILNSSQHSGGKDCAPPRNCKYPASRRNWTHYLMELSLLIVLLWKLGHVFVDGIQF